MLETTSELQGMTTSEKSNPELIERGERVAVFVDVEVSECQGPSDLFLFGLFDVFVDSKCIIPGMHDNTKRISTSCWGADSVRPRTIRELDWNIHVLGPQRCPCYEIDAANR